MSNETEIWKDVKGFEGYYQISNWGRVKSLDREYVDRRGRTAKIKGQILKKRINLYGYHHIGLCKDSGQINGRVHQLVWDHFGDKPRNGLRLQIDHIDGDKLNNHISNLQLLTPRENTIKHYKKLKRELPTGVYYDKKSEKYYSRIYINGRSKHLGSFDSVKNAVSAYENYKTTKSIYIARSDQ